MNKEKRFNVEEHPTLDGRIIDVFPVSHRYIHELEQQVKKQKEVIDKAIECIKKEDEPLYINQWDTLYDGTFIDNYVESNLAQEVLDILNEVSE